MLWDNSLGETITSGTAPSTGKDMQQDATDCILQDRTPQGSAQGAACKPQGSDQEGGQERHAARCERLHLAVPGMVEDMQQEEIEWSTQDADQPREQKVDALPTSLANHGNAYRRERSRTRSTLVVLLRLVSASVERQRKDNMQDERWASVVPAMLVATVVAAW